MPQCIFDRWLLQKQDRLGNVFDILEANQEGVGGGEGKGERGKGRSRKRREGGKGEVGRVKIGVRVNIKKQIRVCV